MQLSAVHVPNPDDESKGSSHVGLGINADVVGKAIRETTIIGPEGYVGKKVIVVDEVEGL